MPKPIDVKKLQAKIAKKQATINAQSKKMKTAPKYIFLGWDGSSGNYPEQGKKPVWLIALIHEYGLGGHDELRMLHTTVETKSASWSKLYTKLLRKSARLGRTPNYTGITEKVGQRMKADLQQYIYSIDLVDTHRLVNSMLVRYKRR